MFSSPLHQQLQLAATAREEAAANENYTLSRTRRQQRDELAERYFQREREQELQAYMDKVIAEDNATNNTDPAAAAADAAAKREREYVPMNVALQSMAKSPFRPLDRSKDLAVINGGRGFAHALTEKERIARTVEQQRLRGIGGPTSEYSNKTSLASASAGFTSNMRVADANKHIGGKWLGVYDKDVGKQPPVRLSTTTFSDKRPEYDYDFFRPVHRRRWLSQRRDFRSVFRCVGVLPACYGTDASSPPDRSPYVRPPHPLKQFRQPSAKDAAAGTRHRKPFRGYVAQGRIVAPSPVPLTRAEQRRRDEARLRDDARASQAAFEKRQRFLDIMQRQQEERERQLLSQQQQQSSSLPQVGERDSSGGGGGGEGSNSIFSPRASDAAGSPRNAGASLFGRL